jgi:hypothetical protein
MDKHRLTTADKNNESFPTIVNMSNDDSHIDETARFLNEHVLSNILSEDENKFPFPNFIEKSFYCLGQRTPPRYQCLKLISWPWFERLSMLIILLNCITLGMYQPCAHHTDKCSTALCIWLEAIDYLILGFFTIEMCIKMLAMGIFGKGSYLAESWNRLDCFIVLAGYDQINFNFQFSIVNV